MEKFLAALIFCTAVTFLIMHYINAFRRKDNGCRCNCPHAGSCSKITGMSDDVKCAGVKSNERKLK